MALETERLILRDFEPDDWRAVCAYRTDPAVMLHMLRGQGTESQTRQLVMGSIACARRQPRTFYGLGVVLRSEARLIGLCTLTIRGRRGDWAQVGWDLDRHFWNQGLGTEVARALCDFAFGTLGVRGVEADSFVGNAASIRVMEKIGMQREPNRLREWLHTRRYHESRPMVCFCIRASEWEHQMLRRRRAANACTTK